MWNTRQRYKVIVRFRIPSGRLDRFCVYYCRTKIGAKILMMARDFKIIYMEDSGKTFVCRKFFVGRMSSFDRSLFKEMTDNKLIDALKGMRGNAQQGCA